MDDRDRATIRNGLERGRRLEERDKATLERIENVFKRSLSFRNRRRALDRKRELIGLSPKARVSEFELRHGDPALVELGKRARSERGNFRQLTGKELELRRVE